MNFQSFILKNKSKDKYTFVMIDLSQKSWYFVLKVWRWTNKHLYQKSSIEKIDNFKDEIIQIKNTELNQNQ